MAGRHQLCRDQRRRCGQFLPVKTTFLNPLAIRSGGIEDQVGGRDVRRSRAYVHAACVSAANLIKTQAPSLFSRNPGPAQPQLKGACS